MLNAIELFAGAGGLGIGVSLAGFKPLAVVELDKYCCDTIRLNAGRGLEPLKHFPLIEGDVRGIDFTSFEDKVHLVSGGPPCQPFSLGGKHGGRDDVRDLFPEAVRVVRQTRPQAFVFENVKGLTRATFANYYEYVFLQLSYPELRSHPDEQWFDHLSRLEKHHTSKGHKGLHYRVVRRVLNAANYGVPQKRERVFFVGFRSDLGIEWNFPEPTHSKAAMLWSQWGSGEYWERHKVAKKKRPKRNGAKTPDDPPATKPWTTVRDALSGLPDPEREPLIAAMFHDHRFQPGARSYPGHTGSPLDEPAKTLKAGVHGVPGGENMMVRADGSVRYFTVRETARLQTFPDDIRFHGSWTETMRQLGNAVPVELARQIVSSVRRHIESHKTVAIPAEKPTCPKATATILRKSSSVSGKKSKASSLHRKTAVSPRLQRDALTRKSGR